LSRFYIIPFKIFCVFIPLSHSIALYSHPASLKTVAASCGSGPTRRRAAVAALSGRTRRQCRRVLLAHAAPALRARRAAAPHALPLAVTDITTRFSSEKRLYVRWSIQ